MADSSLISTQKSVKTLFLYFVIFIVVVLILHFCSGSLQGMFKSSPVNTNEIETYEIFDQLSFNDLKGVPTSNFKDSNFTSNNILPEIPIQIVSVYKINEPELKFGIEDIAEEIANRLNFENNPTKKSKELTWNEGSKFLIFGRLDRHINYKNTSVKANYDPEIFDLDHEELISNTENLVSSIGIIDENIDFNTLEVDYLNKSSFGKYKEAINASNAEFISLRIYKSLPTLQIPSTYSLPVESLNSDSESKSANDSEDIANEITYEPFSFSDYNGGDINKNDNDIDENDFETDNVLNDNTKVVLDNYLSAPLEIILGVNEESSWDVESIYSLNYIHWEYSDELIGSYEIFSPQQAWQNIENGQGVVQELYSQNEDRYVSIEKQNYSQISIETFIADYKGVELLFQEPESLSKTTYVYPIYSFKGKAKKKDAQFSTSNEGFAEFVIYTAALKNNNQE